MLSRAADRAASERGPHGRWTRGFSIVRQGKALRSLALFVWPRSIRRVAPFGPTGSTVQLNPLGCQVGNR
ncbi:hypothetical protein BRD01_06510 [Halobacteriales archaeon QS_8_65_32]|nr:MAG: hypothetical protein BRD01_06510 [Halobacteriales archaeon QS_8_65_32]